MVSPIIKYNNDRPTLLQAYAYFMSLVESENICPPAPVVAFPTPIDPSRYSLQELKEDLDIHSFKIGDTLGSGRCGEVSRAKWFGEEVALKICDCAKNPDLEREFLNEVAAYKTLKHLQGLYIPKLKAAGYAYAGMFFLIATEIAGEPIEVENLTDQERLGIAKAYMEIHRSGIVQGDVRPENILIKRDGNEFKVSIVDLGFSLQTKNERKYAEEMICLRHLLRLSRLQLAVT